MKNLNLVRYIGVKLIDATPMTRQEYNDYRGWKLPSDENGSDEGFLVEYIDSPNSNHENHKGYISWSPKKVFEEAYKRTTGMTFGLALEALKQGKKVARKGWNGKGMWIKLVEGRSLLPLKGQPIESDFTNENGGLEICSHIDMFSADQKQVVGWLASQTDMLAEDWEIID